jgi:hypothetical protein
MGSACYSGNSFGSAHINPRIKRKGTSRQIGSSAAAKELAVGLAQGAEKKITNLPAAGARSRRRSGKVKAVLSWLSGSRIQTVFRVFIGT